MFLKNNYFKIFFININIHQKYIKFSSIVIINGSNLSIWNNYSTSIEQFQRKNIQNILLQERKTTNNFCI